MWYRRGRNAVPRRRNGRHPREIARVPAFFRLAVQVRQRRLSARFQGLDDVIAAHLADHRQVQQLAEQEALAVRKVRDHNL
jgi:hypothetical protein